MLVGIHYGSNTVETSSSVDDYLSAVTHGDILSYLLHFNIVNGDLFIALWCNIRRPPALFTVIKCNVWRSPVLFDVL